MAKLTSAERAEVARQHAKRIGTNKRRSFRYIATGETLTVEGHPKDGTAESLAVLCERQAEPIQAKLGKQITVAPDGSIVADKGADKQSYAGQSLALNIRVFAGIVDADVVAESAPVPPAIGERVEGEIPAPGTNGSKPSKAK